MLAGLEDAPRIIHGVSRVPVSARAKFPDRPVTLIPAYPDLPMEEVYPRGERTDVPELYLRELPAGGRVAYFNWDIDRTFWEVLAADHGRLLANAVRWAANEDPPATVEGQGLLDLAIWRQERSITVHLVNLTNPMAMRGLYRELVPSPPQTLRLRLGDGAKPTAVRLLVRDEEPETRIADGWVELNVPPILDHEVVAVDLDR